MTTRTATALLILASLWSLAGCHRGPAEGELRDQLQGQLDSGFHKGLFTITELVRRGHYPFTADDGADGLLVYYDAELELREDRALSDWDQLNVGSLISVLGATPRGVKGVKAEGNRRGDRITVHGSLAFGREGEGWKLASYGGEGARRAEPAPSDKRDLPYRQELEQISELGERLHSKSGEGDLRFLTGELERVRAAAERRLGRREGLLTLSTGSTSGEYFRQGTELAKILTEAGTKARAFTSGGSIENCQLVEAGEVMFAYTQNDIAHMAYNGTGLFKGQLPLKHLRSLASLYPEAVQVVTLRKSGVGAIGELRGKQVDVGVAGSGSRINAVELLEANGLALSDLGRVQGKEPAAALADLREGSVDAVILTSAFPSPAVRQLAEQEELTLVGLSEESLAALTLRWPFLIAITLPERTYPGMDAPCQTVGVTATLLTHERTKAARVELVLEKLFASVDRLSAGGSQGYLISTKRARTGLSIPLHPAAERFLER